MFIAIVWWPFAAFFFAAAVFREYLVSSHITAKLETNSSKVLVVPFLRPSNKVGDTPPLPYYLYAHSISSATYTMLTELPPGIALWASE